MAQPLKQLPELGLPPDYGQFFPPPRPGSYRYFDLASNDFYFNINDPQPSPVPAWIMAECSLLVYEEPEIIQQVLSQTQVFGKHSYHWLLSGNEYANHGASGFLIEAETFVLVVFRGTEFYRLKDIHRNLRKLQSVWLDLITDLKVRPKIHTETQPCFDTAIHSGFYDALKNLWTPITVSSNMK